MCSHQALAFWEFTRGTGRSAAQIYVAFVGAFDAVLRQLVFGSNQLPFDDAGIAHIVHALGLPPSVMHHIASELSSQCILRRMDVPAVLSRSVAEAHAHTWFSTLGLGAVAHRGLAAGPETPWETLFSTSLNVMSTPALKLSSRTALPY